MNFSTRANSTLVSLSRQPTATITLPKSNLFMYKTTKLFSVSMNEVGMHKLYTIYHYLKIDNKPENWYLLYTEYEFTEKNRKNRAIWFNSFDGFYNAVIAGVYFPVLYATKSKFFCTKHIKVTGRYRKTIITKKVFTKSTHLEICYELNSPNDRNIGYFRDHLSATEFTVFMQEQCSLNSHLQPKIFC